MTPMEGPGGQTPSPGQSMPGGAPKAAPPRNMPMPPLNGATPQLSGVMPPTGATAPFNPIAGAPARPMMPPTVSSFGGSTAAMPKPPTPFGGSGLPPFKPVDAMKPPLGGPVPPPGGAAHLPEDPFKGQDTVRKVLMVVIFIVLLVVIGLVTLVLVSNNKDQNIEEEMTNGNTETSTNSPENTYQPALTSDAERATALDQVLAAMKLYYRDYNRDPEVRGITAQDRWVNLMGHLVSGGYLLSPVQDDGLANYDYQVTPDGKSFVIAVTLTDSSSDKTMSDFDGVPLGVNCADPVYCLGYVK